MPYINAKYLSTIRKVEIIGRSTLDTNLELITMSLLSNLLANHFAVGGIWFVIAFWVEICRSDNQTQENGLLYNFLLIFA